ncbi:MAG: SPOR domain-containing protein [Bacteroidetes bacterium]|nr:MAG: SPOR domain-containing protein [Bacteroidota bacterium]
MNPNIDIYLRSAFKELDAFAIPRVGTFRKVHRAAQIASELGEVHPPVLEIEFDPEVNESLLLTGYLTNNIHMGKGEAEQIVSDISQTITHALKTRRKFEIAEIGQLRRNAEGKLSFSASYPNRSIFSDDYFGLQPVQYATPGKPADIDQSASVMDVAESNGHETAKPASTSALKPVIMVGLIFMLGISIIYTARQGRASLATGVKMPVSLLAEQAEQAPEEAATLTDAETAAAANTPAPAQEDTSPLASAEPGRTAAAPSAQSAPSARLQTPNVEQVEPSRDETIETLPADELFASRGLGNTRGESSEKEKEAVMDISVLDTNLQESQHTRGLTSGKMYYLIMGSFTNERKARQQVEELKKTTHYRPVILYPPDGTSIPYRVAIFKSSSRSKALQMRDQLRKNGYEGVWVFSEEIPN